MGKALLSIGISIFLSAVLLSFGLIAASICVLVGGIIMYKVDRLEYLIKEMKSGSEGDKTE